jgi:glutamate N-acetyltransferase / amino-acid N-acetyltransferase
MTPGPGIARTPLPAGFTASGINSGVRRYRPDLGIIISDTPAVAVGVFTQSQCRGAHVEYCQELLPSTDVMAIVTNSGQANAATGIEGKDNNREMAFAAAMEIGCFPRQVLTASTGVIGAQLEIGKIKEAMPALCDGATEKAEDFALAILTTDLVPKTVTTVVELSGGSVRITGICKGSGMIHPNMATMLGYLLTDAIIPVETANKILKTATDLSFNMISVDGDSSPNDTVFLMANGKSGVGILNDKDYETLLQAFIDISKLLAQSIAIDGEGATKLVEVVLSGAPDEQMAKKAARGITVSPLIKSAVHGADPNWGRILARLGAEQVPARCLEQMTLSIQGQMIFKDGRPLNFPASELRTKLKTDKVIIEVDLRSGEGAATAWGCDLSKKYVDINAEYTT